MSEQAAKTNYFLVTGKVIFTVNILPVPENPQIEEIELNSLVNQNASVLSRKSISNAQLALQQHFAKRIGDDAPVSINDVVITNIVSLGLMTEEEFNNADDLAHLEKEPAKPNLSVVQNDSTEATE